MSVCIELRVKSFIRCVAVSGPVYIWCQICLLSINTLIGCLRLLPSSLVTSLFHSTVTYLNCIIWVLDPLHGFYDTYYGESYSIVNPSTYSVSARLIRREPLLDSNKIVHQRAWDLDSWASLRRSRWYSHGNMGKWTVHKINTSH